MHQLCLKQTWETFPQQEDKCTTGYFPFVLCDVSIIKSVWRRGQLGNYFRAKTPQEQVSCKTLLKFTKTVRNVELHKSAKFTRTGVNRTSEDDTLLDTKILMNAACCLHNTNHTIIGSINTNYWRLVLVSLPPTLYVWNTCRFLELMATFRNSFSCPFWGAFRYRMSSKTTSKIAEMHADNIHA